MAILVKPKIGRRSGKFNGELPFIITGTNDSALAKAALLDQAPGEYDGFSQSDASVEELFEGSATAGIWDGTVQYADPELGLFDSGDTSFSFDVGGGTQHITFSKDTRAIYKPGGTAPAATFWHQINVTPDGIEGVDIPATQFEFEERRIYSADQVTPTFLRAIYLLCNATTNIAPYHSLKAGDFEVGELTLLRASGNERENGKMEITFRFAASPNVRQFTVGTITIGNGSAVVKYGWDYVWVRSEPHEDTVEKIMVMQPSYVVIERIFDAADYSIIENQP